ncbi:hypothetical protein [Aggregatilinea sp.]|uniref:hypothetical protein n=1 Tax=Aggregatilinea sp. TaxID=2806333 RepID=UPI002D1FAEEA|nr:hypothetical protein [Aggregatilinea sp.]
MQKSRRSTGDDLTISDRLAVPMSSGYTLIIKRPSMEVVRAINAKAIELYPDPEPPTQKIETVTGATYQVLAPGDDPEFAEAQKAYEQALQQAQGERAQHFLEYIFKARLRVEGYETEEARQELISKYAEERAAVEEFGSVPEDMKALDDWQFTLRMFIVADAVDYGALTLAAHKAFDVNDISEDELRSRVTFL